MALMPTEENIDLSAVPLPFLEAYPNPAFVLVIPVTTKSRPKLISRDTDITIRNFNDSYNEYDDISPLSGPSRQPFPSNPVTWGNEKWYRLTQGRAIGDCLEMNQQNRLQAWIEGESSEPQDFSNYSNPSLSPLNPSSLSSGLGLENSFKLDIKWPNPISLSLTKTILPLSPPSKTHVFCIITSQTIIDPISSSSLPHTSWSNLTSPTECPSQGSSIATHFKRSIDSSFSGSATEFSQQKQAHRISNASEARSSSFASTDDTQSSSSNSGHRNSSSTGLRTSVDVGPSVSQIGSPSTTPGSSTMSSSYFNTALWGTQSDKIRSRSSRRKDSPHGGHRLSIAAKSRTNDTESEQFWQMVENIDWSKTPLGPRSQWKDIIDPLLSIVFDSKSSDCLWLGPDLRLIYNKGYSLLLDHPKSMGSPAKDVWASIWPTIEPYVQTCLSGTPVFKDNDPIFWKRYGNNILMEHYHSWRYVPIAGKDGSILGIFNQSVEVTEKVLQDRRLATARDLSERMLVVRSHEEYFDAVTEVLEENSKDVPFFMCYKIQQTENDSTHVQLEASLEASVGVPENHSSAQQKLSFSLPPTRTRANFGPNVDRLSSPTLSAISALSSGSGRVCHVTSDGHQWPILKALNTRQCVIVNDCSELIKGYPTRQWDELPFAAIVIPICSDGAIEVPEAVMVMGLNVRRPFDADYDAWVNAIRSQLVTSLTAVKAVEAEQRLEEDHARMEKAKAAWFRGAAHDLRSPLTLIAGPISDLLDSNPTAQQRQAITTAQRNIDRLMRLVNALMDFSRLEAGRMEGRFLPTDLGAFVSELAALFRPAVERLGIQYNIDIEPRDELSYIDPTLFETIISNIIGNALKYTEKGSITVQVRYTDFAEISIIDSGVGIPADEVPLVTEWYHRATTAIHAGTQGSGLGLALAKELLRLHAGDLTVTSQVATTPNAPHGSVFTARIPLSFKPRPPTTSDSANIFGRYGTAVANEAMRWAREDAESSSEGAATDSAPGSGSKFSESFLFDKDDTILLVEDNTDMRNYIKQIFSPLCTVIEATNGQQALEMAISNPPSLILSDMLMPKMNGLELLQEVRNHPNTKIIPMVLLSAVAGDESRVEALMIGAEDYLAKPFKPKELVARVHLHLQVGKKRAHLEKMYMERETEIAVVSDYCPSGIMRADGETGALTYANKAWREQSDLLNDDPNKWPECVDDETRGRLEILWANYIKGNETELRVNWKYNTGKVISGIFVKLDQINPNMSGILGCTTDITHEEERLIEAEQRRQEAEESKHQQELLIDLTSHEIRTPVSAILQCSSLVKENLISLKDQLKISSMGSTGFIPSKELLEDLEEDVEALESIYQCGLVQERIAGDVLSLARIQLDMLSLYDIEVDLRREARKVSSVFASEAKTKKIDLQLVFGNTLELSKVMSIKTDPVRLGQVVTNLISNAIRFTSASDTRRITVKYDISFTPPAEESCALPHNLGIPSKLPAEEDTPIWLFVSVTDTGPGMSPKELAVLFKRFAQGNKMIHTKYGGSGLGLFICRKITELLGGRIEVLSQLGEGSVFRFFIKTRTVAPPSALAAYVEAVNLGSLKSPADPSSSLSPSPSPSIMSSGGTSSSGLTSPPPVPDLNAEHILIVEDNVINQTVLKRQIVKAGLTCDVANNGLEALNLIREAYRQSKRGGESNTRRRKPYDVVLMDLEMPVMDGLTAIKELRDAENAGNLNRNMVIALTGNARQGQIDQAIAAGMDDVVIKPYVLKNLLTKIKAMTAKRAELERASRKD